MGSTFLFLMRAGTVALVLALALPARGDVVVATEFFHRGISHYFVTAFAGEEATLDAHPVWARTATQYRVHDAPGPGLVPVCRFFSASFAPLSSHFYTADEAECEIVKRNPSWTYEGIAFFVQPATADGTCAAGWDPVYRLYNNGLTGAPNHRYTPWSAERANFIARGWIAEGAGPLGVAFCVPVDASGPSMLLPLAERNWIFRFQPDTLTTIHHMVIFGPVARPVDPSAGDEVRDLFWSTFGFFDPYLARLVVHLEGNWAGTPSPRPPARLVVEHIAPDALRGCLYQQVDWTSTEAPARFGTWVFSPCLAFDAYRP